MKKSFKPGQSIEVEVYNFEKRKSEWVPGIFIEKVQASDIAFRYAVELNGMRL
jgi:predicted HTH domain antitoxin